MDKITESFVKEFSKNKNYESYSSSDAFELFTNYCIITKEYENNHFELKSTLTGRATQGIDGISIIVNNKIVESKSEIMDLIETNNFLDVTFLFIQSKESSKFNGTDMESFFSWVNRFFTKTKLFESIQMKNFIEMKDYIYENSISMTRRNPICKLFYVTTGNRVFDDKNLNIIIESSKEDLNNLQLFDKVHIEMVGARELQMLYRKSKEPISATIKFENKVTLPSIPNVKVAYSGFLPFIEFKKIIMNEEGQVKPVFEDNIRDYLKTDDNLVNKDIRETITSSESQFFSILNNGVTVVAEKFNGPPGNEFTITNYQIVNGCQTSHVLYEFRDLNTISNINIPVKIIVTEDDDIKSKITHATNNQTAVKIEQLEALNNFQKNLEDFYNAMCSFDTNVNLYYERRTNQYRNLNIADYSIITIENQIKSFASMFLNEPHLVSGSYGKLTKNLEEFFFKADHKYHPYYVSALAYFILENYFNKGFIPNDLWRFRYHFLMLIRIKVLGKKVPFLSSNEIEKNSEQLKDVLLDDKKISLIINEIETIIRGSDLKIGDRKVTERKETTDYLINECENISNKLKTSLCKEKLFQVSLF